MCSQHECTAEFRNRNVGNNDKPTFCALQTIFRLLIVTSLSIYSCLNGFVYSSFYQFRTASIVFTARANDGSLVLLQ